MIFSNNYFKIMDKENNTNFRIGTQLHIVTSRSKNVIHPSGTSCLDQGIQ